MSFIAQKDNTDCGVACVATLTGVTYGEAARLIFGQSLERKKSLSTTTRQVREAISKTRVFRVDEPRLKTVRSKKWSDIPYWSLVKVPDPAGRANWWHWVVWTGQMIWDPYHGLCDPAKYSARPSSYLTVRRI